MILDIIFNHKLKGGGSKTKKKFNGNSSVDRSERH